MKRWQGKYRAVVDGDPNDWVDDSVFPVKSQDYEAALRSFETSAYEVVRCDILSKTRYKKD